MLCEHKEHNTDLQSWRTLWGITSHVYSGATGKMPASAKLERSAWAHTGCAVCPHSAQVIALAAPALSVQLEQCEQGSELIPSWASPSSLNVMFFEACSYTVLMRVIRSGNGNLSLPFNFELRWPMSGTMRSHDGSWKSNHLLTIGMLNICLCL